MISRWFKEISTVGICDWFWFVLYLRRNEFSPKLDLFRYYPDKMNKLVVDRNRAHKIDMEFSAIV